MHGILLIDKPLGPTSHDVVAWVRRAFRTRAVGHTGTLDPMATGVLVVAIGEGTKLVPYLTATDKSYEATVELGVETDSLDAQGEMVARADVPAALDREAVQRVADTLLGEQWQVPPMVSAIKVGGEALHVKARRGEVVEVAPRRVWLREVAIMQAHGSAIQVRLACGKGFYVRAFARDLAQRLGTLGHLSQLRRLTQGPFDIERCTPGALVLAARQDDGAREALAAAVLPLSEACAHMPRRVLSAEGCVAAHHGQPIARTTLVGTDEAESLDGPVCLLDEAGVLRAVAMPDGDRLRVVRGFRYG